MEVFIQHIMMVVIIMVKMDLVPLHLINVKYMDLIQSQHLIEKELQKLVVDGDIPYFSTR